MRTIQLASGRVFSFSVFDSKISATSSYNQLYV